MRFWNRWRRKKSSPILTSGMEKEMQINLYCGGKMSGRFSFDHLNFPVKYQGERRRCGQNSKELSSYKAPFCTYVSWGYNQLIGIASLWQNEYFSLSTL